MKKRTSKKLINLMMAGMMAAGVMMAPASTFAAKTAAFLLCIHPLKNTPGKRLSETGTGQWTGKIPLIW